MKDKWKVFIKGNPNRGDEVIKLLTDLGANNRNNYYGRDNTGYYFINPNGEIGYACSEFSRSLVYPFLHEFYTEIKLPKRKKMEGWRPSC